jgi:hypothetical protein
VTLFILQALMRMEGHGHAAAPAELPQGAAVPKVESGA